jgi:hypothetical protein
LKLDEHRGWEDVLAITLGGLMMISPFVAGNDVNTAVTLSAVLAGAVVVILGAMELSAPKRWEEVLMLVAGAWMMAAPYALGYAGALQAWHITLGAITALLALFEIWQDVGRRKV